MFRAERDQCPQVRKEQSEGFSRTVPISWRETVLLKVQFSVS